MSIVATCSCGQSFRAKPELAGKRVKCPACSAVLQIPPAEPAPPLAPLDDPLGLGGFDEQAMGAPLPQMPASQPLQPALPSYSAPKPQRDWGPIVRIGLIGGGVVIVIGVLATVGVLLWTMLGKHRSPEAVFQAAKEAAEKQDWEEFCECLTPESRDQMAGMMVFGAVMMKAFSGMAAMGGPDKAQEAEEKLKPVMDVLARHGLDEDTLKDMDAEKRMMPGRPDNERLQQLLAPVKNRNKLVADMIAAMQGVGNNSGASTSPMESDATLEDLQVNEDSATGYIVQTKNGKQRRDKIGFAKVDGSWKIDLSRSR